MYYTVQAITVDGDVACETRHQDQDQAYDFADTLADGFCKGWRHGGKVVVSDESGEVRVTLLGEE